MPVYKKVNNMADPTIYLTNILLPSKVLKSVHWHNHIIIDIIFYTSTITYYFGSVNYLIHQFQNDGSISEVSLNLSLMLSLTHANVIAYWIRKHKPNFDDMCELLVTNPYLDINSKIVRQQFEWNNCQAKMALVYSTLIFVPGIIYVEFNICRIDNIYACHYVIPSVGNI